MSDTRTVVITGGTRGIGKGMAREFLKRGHRVVVCGRSNASAAAAAAELAEHGEVLGQGCDVSDFASVQALWDAAVERFAAPT